MYYITYFIINLYLLYLKWIFISFLHFRRNERQWCREALEVIKRHFHEDYCRWAAAKWFWQSSSAKKMALLWSNVFYSGYIVKYTVCKLYQLIVIRTILIDILFCRTVSNESQRPSFSEEDVSNSSQTSKHFYLFYSEVFDNKVAIFQWKIYEYYLFIINKNYTNNFRFYYV